MSILYILDFLNAFSGVFTTIFIIFGVILGGQVLVRFEKQQKMVNTINFLSKFYRDLPPPLEALKVISADDFAMGLDKQPDSKVAAFQKILNYLNEMELVALLVNSGTVDERMASKMMRSTIVQAFRLMIEYIMKTRISNENSSLYIELESLAHRWGNGRDFR